MNIAYYTCFYGNDNNSAFKIPIVPSLKYKCYYYTNNSTLLKEISKTKWKGVFIDKPPNNDKQKDCMDSKHIKSMPHEYDNLKTYDYLCYIDSKVDHVNETFVENMIQKYFIENDYALLLRQHWYIHNDIWNEYNASMEQPRYEIDREKYRNYIETQIKNGLSERVDQHCATGFLIRNMKHDKIQEINQTWYEHIQQCGIQCQISFFFVKQLFNEFIHPFKEYPYILSVNSDQNAYDKKILLATEYCDNGCYIDAINVYKSILDYITKADNKYNICWKLYNCYKQIGKEPHGFFYLVESFKYSKKRVECLYPLLVHYTCSNMCETAYNYYLHVKEFYENHYLTSDFSNLSLIESDKYNFHVPYYIIIIADRLNNRSCGIKMFEIIFIKKQLSIDEFCIKNLLFNLQFFLPHIPETNTNFINLANEYIQFLYQNNMKSLYDFINTSTYKDYGIDVSKYIV